MAARKGRPVPAVVRTGVAEALRMSFSPLEEIPESMFELAKRLDGLTPLRLTIRERPGKCEGRKAMNDLEDPGTKVTQKARETAEKGRQAAEEAVRGVGDSYSTAFDNVRNFNVRLIDAAQANADAVCALARDIATTRKPSDLLGVWMNHAQKQFNTATKQANDLTALGQKFVTESTAPMTQSFQQAFKRGTT
jgi:hypothetical protein